MRFIIIGIVIFALMLGVGVYRMTYGRHNYDVAIISRGQILFSFAVVGLVLLILLI